MAKKRAMLCKILLLFGIKLVLNSRQRGHGCVFWGTISEKKAFCLLASPKKMLFLTIFNENIFSQNSGH